MTDRSAENPAGAPPKAAQGWILASVSVLDYVSPLAIAPVLPIMSKIFSDTPHADLLVRLIVSMPALAAILSGPLLGFIQLRYGAKRILLVGLGAFAFGGGATVLLHDLPAILAAALLQGFGATTATTSAMTIVSGAYCTEDRHVLLGRRGLIKVSGAALSLASAFLAELDWRLVFALFPLALAAIPLVARGVAEADGQARRPRRVRDSPSTAPAANARDAHTRVAAVVATAALGGGALICIPSMLPFLVESQFEAPPASVGVLIAIYTLTGIAAVTFRAVRRRLSASVLSALLFCCIGAGYALISVATCPAAAGIGVAVAGLGGCLMVPNLTSWSMEIPPSPSHGHNLALMQLGFAVGVLCGPLSVQPLIGLIGVSRTFGVVGAALAALAIGATSLRLLHRRARGT